MNNKYFEFSIKPKNENKEKIIKNILFAIKIVDIVLTVIIGYFAFMFTNYMWIIFAVLLTIAIVLNYFQHKLYNFYDVVFVDGDISISKVINNVKRRNLIKFSAKNVINIGFLGGETYNLYLKDKSVKKIHVGENLLSGDVCFLVSKNEVKTLLLLPYNEIIIVQILKFCGTNKLDKGFIDVIKLKETL